MKRTIGFIALALLLIATPAYARGFRRHFPVPTPAPAPTPPPVTVLPSSTVQVGAFTGTSKTFGTYQAFFLADGDSFTADAQGLTDPLAVYWESSYTAAQIVAGKADSFLKNWAVQMKAYGKPIIFIPFDEMNLPENPYSGNTAAFKSAYHRVRNFFSDANVKFAYDPNVSFPGNPISNFMAYYPGDNYVDLIGLDGFDFGGQTFAQVFNTSIAAMKTDFPAKPLWILSTGSVDNQPAFIQAAFKSGVNGIIFFSYQQFVLTSAAQSTLKSLE